MLNTASKFALPGVSISCLMSPQVRLNEAAPDVTVNSQAGLGAVSTLLLGSILKYRPLDGERRRHRQDEPLTNDLARVTLCLRRDTPRLKSLRCDFWSAATG